MWRDILRTWGEDPRPLVADFAPSQVDNDSFVRWTNRFNRLSVSPGSLLDQLLSISTTTGSIPDVPDDIPTLGLHAEGDRVLPVGHGRALAEQMPPATYVELPGDDHMFFAMSNWREFNDRFIEAFTGEAPRARTERPRRPWPARAEGDRRHLDPVRPRLTVVSCQTPTDRSTFTGSWRCAFLLRSARVRRRARRPQHEALLSRPSASSTVGGHLECFADLAHPRLADPSDSLDEQTHRHRLHRVQIHGASAGHGIYVWLHHHLACQSADGRRARSDQCSPQSRNGGVTGEHHDRSPTDLGWFAPPHFTATRKIRHRAEAFRKDSRSPHSSGSSSGWAAYAAAYSASISAARCCARRAANASSMSSASLAPALVRRALSRSSPSTVVLSLVRAMPQSCHLCGTTAMSAETVPLSGTIRAQIAGEL